VCEVPGTEPVGDVTSRPRSASVVATRVSYVNISHVYKNSLTVFFFKVCVYVRMAVFEMC
jgi:hypothetical protein